MFAKLASSEQNELLFLKVEQTKQIFTAVSTESLLELWRC